MPSPYDCITDFIFVETGLAPADVIVVPGGSYPQSMEKAAALCRQGLAQYILPSGGANPRLETTEWEFLRDVGMAHGVPEAAILKEDRAQNTFQNARYSLEVLRQAGIRHGKVIMVCKSWHSRRALLTYQTAFPQETEFFIAPVRDSLGIGRDNWFLSEEGIRRTLKEVEKIGAYFGRKIQNWASSHRDEV
ncbi:YdcF family protein [Paenibacillus doosanensis]|uniref:YdcF family protein n=1 Tax=Paenibacillus doosanensis TaxID=1229154 RepID=UPI00218076DD|nr:YdcF family protein [Paenibacillus doosanensis]MCS7464403.1 YdcF family protein [Paenibacillus doosanensis]